MHNKRELSYERLSKNLDLLPEVHEEMSSVSKTDVAAQPASRQLKGYEKTDGVMSYSIVCVISGGERKERDFLRVLIRQKELFSLRVAFISEDNQGLQPYQMQQRWEEIQKNNTVVLEDHTIQLDEVDKVFLLSDVDEFYEQLVKIKKKQDKADTGQWIISNPCFELWLYHCLYDNPQEDLAGIEALGVEHRSQQMKRLENVKGGLNPIRAFEHMQEGITRSINHYKEDGTTIPVLFATQMYQMAKFLVDTMNSHNNEYDEFVRQKREWNIKMKKSRLNKSAQKEKHLGN